MATGGGGWEHPGRVNMKRRSILALPLAAPALAQEAWPGRGVTIIVPVAPGSSSDIIARAMGQVMQQSTGKPFVVESRAGASGALGAQHVIRSAPDGTTLLHAALGPWAINVALRSNLSYDPLTQLTRITQTVRTPNVLVLHPSVPATNLAEFIAWLKRPGANIAYASGGIGTSDHITAALFGQVTGTDSTHIPYNGAAPGVAGLLAGNVAFMFQNLGAITPQIRDGRVRALMVTSEARHPALPDVPAAPEAGLPELVVYSWQALGGPAAMPPALLAQVHREAVAALRAPAVTARLNELGFEIVASTPEEFAALQAREVERWRRVVARGNILPE